MIGEQRKKEILGPHHQCSVPIAVIVWKILSVSPRNRDRQNDRDRDENHRGRDSHQGGSSSRRRISPSERPVPKPSKTLGVFGLSILTQEKDLERLFRPYGRVEMISVLKDRDTGKSRGYGFITFDSIESASKAIAGMNGYVYNDRQMRVDFTLSNKKVVSPRRSPPPQNDNSPPASAVPVVVPPGGAPAGFPFAMPPYGYYPYPYMFAPPSGQESAAGSTNPTGEGKDGPVVAPPPMMPFIAPVGWKEGDPLPAQHPGPIMYFDPRNGPSPSVIPGAGGAPPGMPFPMAMYPPYMFDPRAAGQEDRGKSNNRRDSSRDRDRERDRGSGGGRDSYRRERDERDEGGRRRRGDSVDRRNESHRGDRDRDRGDRGGDRNDRFGDRDRNRDRNVATSRDDYDGGRRRDRD
ncbi:hypothetical protein HDU82_000725 [Entophlyctis luteolus]|nr:hypothetical protein HDU82_000725 [Entophlyctis luteolus]